MIKPECATYRYTKKAGEAAAQSRVECRLAGSEISEILAVRAAAYPATGACGDKEVNYGGKTLFFIVYIDGEGRVCRAERGVEFSHRAPCEEADETCVCALYLSADDVSYRREGSNIVVSAVVCAAAEIYKEDEISYLSGGENLVLKKEEKSFTRAALSACDGEENDRFETDYFTDVLLHGETACVKSVTEDNGTVRIDGEIAMNVCVLKADNSLASYERLIPFSLETPAPYFCDEDWRKSGEEAAGGEENGGGSAANAKFRARVILKPANLTVETSEEKNKCFVQAQLAYSVQIVQYTDERIAFCDDAFSTEREIALTREKAVCRKLKCTKTYVKKIEGVAALNAPIDYTVSFLAAALPKAELSVKSTGENTIEFEGAATARLFLSDKDGIRAADMTLPVLFTESADGVCGENGEADGEAEAIACGVALRQKKEGEAEAEVTLKITVYFYETASAEYVSAAEGGEEYGETKCAMSVLLPRGGDGLWETAKSLRKTPEEVEKSNPDLAFPLKDKERILVYNRKR